MRDLEDIILEKIFKLTNLMLSKVINPDMTLNKVSQLDVNMVKRIKQEYGIEAIILDVDETLRKDMHDIPACNQEWIESIKDYIKIIVLSNGVDKNVEKFFREKGIDYIGFAHKPLKKNFIEACKKLNVNPKNILVVGDRLFDDIYGGKRNNMKTMLIKDVDDNER